MIDDEDEQTSDLLRPFLAQRRLSNPEIFLLRGVGGLFSIELFFFIITIEANLFISMMS